ncbi:hypothetical protein CAEBREN_18069 [Caenorhabditis brenneri]|uniref:C-type LECtin n=1 Tax=Caenorhabditis brenneri TaxID=135651 RepID=G0MDV4_CAEBE|nr:hypothetical protein CAEBREN_18069 [Caenorhabditis brenneri]
MILVFLLFALFPHATGIACQRGLTAVNDQKCLMMNKMELKHLWAENSCAQYGGTLVPIKNAVDNRAVANMAASAGATNIWIGIFCFATGNTTTCYHDDGSGTISYNNFASGNPAVQNGGCVYMSVTGQSAGQWVSGNCEVSLPFVCESPTTVADPSCKLNYNGYCYLRSHEIPSTSNITTFTKAQAICQANGGFLLSLHSKPEIDYVRNIYKNTRYSSIFLGAQKFLPNTFDWDDESNWDYDYTDPLSKTKGDCLLMTLPSFKDQTAGLWSRTNCSFKYPFMCKRKILEPTAVRSLKPVQLKETSIEKTVYHSQKNLPHRQELVDFSNCNTTLYMAPGTITSYGYPNIKPPVTYCTWTVATLGPYQLGVYFTDFSVSKSVYLYDEHGNQLGNPSGNQSPFRVLGPSNIVKITHDSSYDAVYGYHGFSATLLPF